MGDFFTYEDFLPEGSGYGICSFEHLICLAITGLIIFLIWKIFVINNSKGRTMILRGLALFNVLLEVIKDFILLFLGVMDKYQLPFHICGMGLFIYFINAFSKRNSKIFQITGEIACTFILPASFSAVIFPDWTMYPVMNFMNFHGYLGHGILVTYPLLLLTGCKTRNTKIREDTDNKDNSYLITPSIKNFIWVILFVVLSAAGVYFIDIFLCVDYYFINWPPYDTPLILIYNLANSIFVYRILYVILLIVMILFMYLLFYLKRIGEKSK